MSVSGLLSTMNMPEILQWIQFSRKTGTVVFERSGIVKKVFFEDGLLISASSNDPKEYLGQILICYGLLTEEQLNEAFKRQRGSGRLLGRVLIEEYKLKESQILDALRVKIEETIYDLFIWDEGRFIYSKEMPNLDKQERLNTAITIDQILFEGARRQDEWSEFRKAFPRDDVVFKTKKKLAKVEGLSDNFLTQKIYSFIDGQKTMRRVLLEVRAPEYRGTETFAKLFWAEMIEPVKGNVVTEAKAAEPVSDLPLAKAVEFFKSGNLEQAYSIIEQHRIHHPDDEEGKTLGRVVEEAYIKILREKCPPDAVPILAIDISALNEKVFNSREGFLASRINGQWDVKSLVMISPLSELDSLRIIKRLLDEGVTRWK